MPDSHRNELGTVGQRGAFARPTKTALLRVTLLTMKYIGDPQLAARLPEIFGLLSVFGERRTVLSYLETLLRYLAVAAVTVSEADVRRALVEVLPTLEERIMPTPSLCPITLIRYA